jgi:uncharacterized protein (DUF305 family)
MRTELARRVWSAVLVGTLVFAAAGTVVAQDRPGEPSGLALGQRSRVAGDIVARGMMQGPGHQGDGGMTPGHPMGGMQNAARHYIEEMIPHHEAAVVMAELGLAQAEHSELRALAVEIIRVQTEEIALMRDWYRAWYGADVAAGTMRGRMMGMGGDHDATAIDGARPFDKAFIEAMIPHHEMAVRMSTMALSRVDQAELRALLTAIIVGQSDEISLMRGWYEGWYRTPVPDHGGMQAH